MNGKYQCATGERLVLWEGGRTKWGRRRAMYGTFIQDEPGTEDSERKGRRYQSIARCRLSAVFAQYRRGTPCTKQFRSNSEASAKRSTHWDILREFRTLGTIYTLAVVLKHCGYGVLGSCAAGAFDFGLLERSHSEVSETREFGFDRSGASSSLRLATKGRKPPNVQRLFERQFDPQVSSLCPCFKIP